MRKTAGAFAALLLVTCVVAGFSAFAVEASDLEKGYDIHKTGLTLRYPADMSCSPLTSFYASWDDVDGTRRDEPHSGVDGGRLGDPIVSPGPGRVVALWRANWGWGEEQALLIKHTKEDLNLNDPRQVAYYSEFDHLNLKEPIRLAANDQIERGQRLATVYRPGGNTDYLPEVHWEVWETAANGKLTWRRNKFGGLYWIDQSARLVDPLYMMALNNAPHQDLNVDIHPHDAQRDYSRYVGFTYILPCRRIKSDGSRAGVSAR